MSWVLARAGDDGKDARIAQNMGMSGSGELRPLVTFEQRQVDRRAL
jgi:hypothetical protein